MINERIRAGAELIKVLGAKASDIAYIRAVKGPHPEENLRSMVLASIELVGIEWMVREVWDAASQVFHDGGIEQTFMLLDPLCDPDIIGPAHEAKIREWVDSHLLQEAVSREGLLEYVERQWKIDYTPELIQRLWSKAIGNLDEDSARRLLSRTPIDRMSYVDVIECKPTYRDPVGIVPAQPAIEVFVRALDNRQLTGALADLESIVDGSPAAKRTDVEDDIALVHLMYLTLECGRRFGNDKVTGARFFDLLDAKMSGFAAKRFVGKVDELAQLAMEVGKVGSTALARIVVYGGHKHLTGEQLADLVGAGMTSGELFLLNIVDASKCRAVAQAMSSAERDAYMFHGIQDGIEKAVKTWRQRGFNSCSDEDIVTILHQTGFAVDQPTSRSEHDEPRWLHERIFGFSDELTRYTFMKLSLLGVLPPDMQFQGHGALNYAAYYGDLKALDDLVKAGHDIEATSSMNSAVAMEEKKSGEYGCTPLLIAAKYGKTEIVRRLVDLGADVGVKTGSGTPVRQITKDEDIRRLLKSVKIGRSIEAVMTGGDPAEDAPRVKTSDIGLL